VCVDKELGRRERKSVRSTADNGVDSMFALVMTIVRMPRNDCECRANRLYYQAYHRQHVDELALSCTQLVLS
jgi:hypothetical protein